MTKVKIESIHFSFPILFSFIGVIAQRSCGVLLMHFYESSNLSNTLFIIQRLSLIQRLECISDKDVIEVRFLQDKVFDTIHNYEIFHVFIEIESNLQEFISHEIIRIPRYIIFKCVSLNLILFLVQLTAISLLSLIHI